MHTHYSGSRVRLRPFRDAAEWRAMCTEQGIEINKHWGCWWQPLRTMEKDFENCGMLGTGGYNAFAVERVDTGELIGMEEYGMEGVEYLKAWIGTFISLPHTGQRFGVEAKQLVYCHLFENYPLQRVYSETVETHSGAAKGLMLSGMRYEGRARLKTIRDGRAYDTVLYALHREEWEAMEYRHSVVRGPWD